MSAATIYLPTNDENGLPFVETASGRCVPAFSSLETLARYRAEGGPYVRIPREALATLCPDDVGVLLDGCIALTSTTASRLTTPLVGEPNEEPEELLATVRAFAGARSEIRTVLRAQLLPPAGAPAICIGFETDTGVDERALLEDAAIAVRAAGHEGVLFVPVSEGDELGQFLRSRPMSE